MLSDTKQTVRRDGEGRKMYPGRFWEWPYPEGPIVLETEDEAVEYGIAMWTETETNMPSLKQIRYVLWLLSSKEGADPERLNWSSKRGMASGINALTRLPMKAGKVDWYARS